MAPTLFRDRTAASAAGEVRELLAAGQRLEFAGAPGRALGIYLTADALADTPNLCAETIRRIGDAHRAQGAWPAALEAYARSLAIAEAAGLGDLAAEALNATGSVAVLQGDVARATAAFEAGLQREPTRRVQGLLHQNLGMCAVRAGSHARALELFLAALACFRESGYRRGELMALNNIGALHIEVGDSRAALRYLREAGRIARDLMDLDLLLLTVQSEAEAYAKLGRLEDAERQIQEAIGHFTTAGNERRLAECLVILGDIQRAHGRPDHDAVATRCYVRAETIARSVDAGELAARARSALVGAGAEAQHPS